MNKEKLSWGKFSPTTFLSLGILILGIGCIFWALFHIWTQPDFNNITSSDSTPIILNGSEDEDVKDIYPDYPVEGDKIGILIIPALDRELLIFQGTEEKQLKKGVGHFIQSVLPGEEDNSVISGHRETVFKQIDDLVLGDQLIVKTSAGTFTYEVSATQIVDKDDKSVIVPTENAVLTMTTCYPFSYIGNAPNRYIISANLVKSNYTLN